LGGDLLKCLNIVVKFYCLQSLCVQSSTLTQKCSYANGLDFLEADAIHRSALWVIRSLRRVIHGVSCCMPLDLIIGEEFSECLPGLIGQMNL
jgi:hypothetical protein